ncbi:hypothetical protein HMPREF1493_0939 [Atopobium sp. ICM42b]|nr:hypothetical protein HMPREF1493_0939 [Atopobium sp. ICM42b]
MLRGKQERETLWNSATANEIGLNLFNQSAIKKLFFRCYKKRYQYIIS